MRTGVASGGPLRVQAAALPHPCSGRSNLEPGKKRPEGGKNRRRGSIRHRTTPRKSNEYSAHRLDCTWPGACDSLIECFGAAGALALQSRTPAPACPPPASSPHSCPPSDRPCPARDPASRRRARPPTHSSPPSWRRQAQKGSSPFQPPRAQRGLHCPKLSMKMARSRASSPHRRLSWFSPSSRPSYLPQPRSISTPRWRETR